MLNVFCLTGNSELRVCPSTPLLYTPGRRRSKFPETREHTLLPPVTKAIIQTVKCNKNNRQTVIAQFDNDIEFNVAKFKYLGKTLTNSIEQGPSSKANRALASQEIYPALYGIRSFIT
jgi:hypothetical protein